MLDAVASWSLDAERDAAPGELARYVLVHPVSEIMMRAPASLIVGGRGGGKTALARAVAEGIGGAASASVSGPALRFALREDVLTCLHAGARRFGPGAEGGDEMGLGALVVRLAVFSALAEAGRLSGSQIRDVAQAFASAPLPANLIEALARSAPRALLADAVAASHAAPNPASDLTTDRADALSGDARPLLPAIDASLARVLTPGEPVTIVFDEAASPRRRVGALDVLIAGGLADILAAGAPAARQGGPLVDVRISVVARPDMTRAARGDVLAAYQHAALTWSHEALQELGAFRLARAASPAFAPGEVRAASVWRRVFAGSARGALRRAGFADGPGGFVAHSARARPRDVVHLLSACAQAALDQRKDVVTAPALRDGQARHAAYVRDSLADEMRAVEPEIDLVLAGLEGLEERRGDAAWLYRALERALAASGATETVASSRQLMQMMFDAGVLGHVVGDARGGERDLYRDAEAGAAFSLVDPVVLHPALAEALSAPAAAPVGARRAAKAA